MANNRMYLYCPPCNETVLIAKHTGSWFDLRVGGNVINAFFSRHAWCGPRDCMCCGSHLQLRYEQTDSTTNHNAEADRPCTGGTPRRFDLDRDGDDPLQHGEGPGNA